NLKPEMGGRVYQVHDETAQHKAHEVPLDPSHSTRPPRWKALSPPGRHDFLKSFRVRWKGGPPAENSPEAGVRCRKRGAQDPGPVSAQDEVREPRRHSAGRARVELLCDLSQEISQWGRSIVDDVPHTGLRSFRGRNE